ncbi:hypothetical protein [Amphritea sp.]|uniref:hypothetical protein n=1 Tax=Amphritea sp. TaxID=1872502 RepID=UPI0025BC807A|nr:hypothetical protein [Amphritea sp.]
MKIFSAVVALGLAVFLFFQAHDMEGISLLRMGYIVGGVSLLTLTLFMFVPPKTDEPD